jgi:hypothetical protein
MLLVLQFFYTQPTGQQAPYQKLQPTMQGEEVDAFEVDTILREMLKKSLSASQIRRIVLFSYSHSFHSIQIMGALLDIMQRINVLGRLNMFYVVDALMKEKTRVTSCNNSNQTLTGFSSSSNIIWRKWSSW